MVGCWGQVGEDLLHGVLFGCRDPQPVGGLHRDLAGHVVAAQGRILRQPGGSISGTFLLVRCTVRRDEVQGVVREALPLHWVQALRPFLPGVAQSHHMIDLDLTAAVLATAEVDVPAGIRFAEVPGRNLAGGALGKDHAGQVAAEDVIAGVAAVPVHVEPGLAKGLPAIAGVRGSAFHCQAVQGREGAALRHRAGLLDRFHPRTVEDGGLRWPVRPGARCAELAGGKEPEENGKDAGSSGAEECPGLPGTPPGAAVGGPLDAHGADAGWGMSGTPRA